MRFEDAQEFVHERTRAAAGQPADAPHGWVTPDTDRETVLRALLSGLDVDDVDAVIETLGIAARNTLFTIAVSGTFRVEASLHGAFAQMFLLGFMTARDS